jgi:hypothetical protein
MRRRKAHGVSALSSIGALDVHRFNFAVLTVWDRLFGTYRDTGIFAARCGFPRHNERTLGHILLFRDVYKD